MAHTKIKIHKYNPKADNFNAGDFTTQVRQLTKKAWGDPVHLASRWIELADFMVTADVDGKLVAFATAKVLENDTLNFIATIVDPDYQGRGLSTKLNLELIWDFLELHPIQLIEGFYVVFRTQNPSLYEKAYGKLQLFPDYRRKFSPSEKELEIFHQIAELYCPDNVIDEKNFVINKAHEKFPDLIYKRDAIPWAKSPAINHFFEERLSLTEGRGDTLVLIGLVKPGHLIKYDLNKTVKYYFKGKSVKRKK